MSIRGMDRSGNNSTEWIKVLLLVVALLVALLAGYAIGLSEGTSLGIIAEQERSEDRIADKAIQILRTSNCFDDEYWSSVINSDKNPYEGNTDVQAKKEIR